MTGAREEILARVRSALPDSSTVADYSNIPRAYRQFGLLAADAQICILKDRLADYDAQVIEVAEEKGIADAVRTAMAAVDETRLFVPSGLPPDWTPRGVELIAVADSAAEMDRAQAVLTGCEVAIAETGTIVLVHSAAQGRRMDTLLPDHHLCVVPRERIVETVPEGWQALAAFAREPLTTISGPSATSDIEMSRIRGVHGPRRLTVLLVDCGARGHSRPRP